MKSLLTFLLVVFYISGQAKTTFPKGSNSSQARPQFHFSSKKHKTGSPVGLIYCSGEYHLFYECKSGKNSLGHAVCNDLLHWKEMPEASVSEENTDIRSMSVIIDKNNTWNRPADNVNPMIVFYTDKHYEQQMAISTDKGKTWEKTGGNLLIPCSKTDSAFVSKVIWHKASAKWIMLMSRKLSGNHRGTSFYSSKDLLNWKWESDFSGFQVSSDLVEFNASSRSNGKIWALFNNKGSYLPGNFDGKNFTKISNICRNNYGRNFYAPQIVRNMPADDGRIIQIAGIHERQFEGQMSVPTVLSMKEKGAGYKLIQHPAKELVNLYDKDYEWKNKNIIPGINQNPMRRLNGKCFHFIADLDIKTSNNFGIVVRHNKKVQGTEILFNIKQKELSMPGVTVPLKPKGDEISFELLIDHTSIELFTNEGEVVVSRRFSPAEGANSYVLFTNGGEIKIEKMLVYSINSVWDKK